MNPTELNHPEFFKSLKRLSLYTRRRFPGQRIGERRTARKGGSVEFKDYREYQPGDDIRHIDWNVWGRLDQFFVKEFYSEENLNVFILLDLSRSMKSGQPSKWDFMLRLAAALSYVSLENEDALRVIPFGPKMLRPMPWGSGKGDWPRILEQLCGLHDSDPARLATSLREFVQKEKRRGILFLLSDFLEPENELMEAFRLLGYYGFDASLIQILSPEELEPGSYGHSILKDQETSQELELDIHAGLLVEYAAALEEHLNMVHRTARRFGLKWRLANSSQEPTAFLVDYLHAQQG